jgi:predicted dehydrogenase
LKKTNFGIIACSNVAKNRFIPAILKSEYANLSFIASRKIDKAKIYAEKFGCNNYGNYEDALTNSKIDAVYISTPINFKKRLALKAIEYGKHIILEKPAFLNSNDASEILCLCKKKKLHFLEGWMFKYHPQHKKFLEIIKKKPFGQIKYFFGQFTYPKPPSGDIRLDPDLNGGVFYDSIGYPLAASIMILNKKPIHLFATLSKDKKHGVDNFVKIHLEYENNIYADLIAGYGLQYKAVYSVLSDKGIACVDRAFSVNDNMETRITLDNDNGKSIKLIKPVDQFKLMIDNFCNDININKIGYHKNSILIQQNIIDSALLSVKTNSLIKIKYEN